MFITIGMQREHGVMFVVTDRIRHSMERIQEGLTV